MQRKLIVRNMTREKLIQILEESNRERLFLLDEVKALDAENLTAKPQPDLWSILEIVEHLVVAEKEVLSNLPDPIQLIEQKRNLRDRLTYPVVMFILKYNVRVPVPSPTMLPKGLMPLPDLLKEWEVTQKWLKSLIETLEPQDFNKPVFSHPVAGGLTVTQAVLMGHLHLKTHARQIRKRRLTQTPTLG